MKSIVMLFVACSLYGCELIDRETDPEIEQYVNEFYYQAEKRGLNLERPNMKMKFKKLNDAQGQCNMVFKTIYIDRESLGWQINPEALVFHELGHLILKRNHRNESVNKYCVSIMSNQDDPIYEYHEGDHTYEWRKYYIDELFDTNTPLPKWMTN